MDLQLHNEIEKYLDKEMSDQERSAFEKRLQVEPQLAEALKEHQEARYAILAYRDATQQKVEDKSEQIRGWVKDAFQEGGDSAVVKKPAWYKKPVWLGLAASFSLLILFTPQINQWAKGGKSIFGDPNYPVLFTKNFIMPTHPTMLGGDPDTARLKVEWNEAVDAFEAGECTTAIPKMEALIKNPDFLHSDEAHLYIGTCLLKEKQTQAAIDQLSSIPSTAGVYQNAQWYIAMAYLQAEDQEKALKAFSDIAENKSSEKWKQAEKIRDLLD
jgi:hypothetical protein